MPEVLPLLPVGTTAPSRCKLCGQHMEAPVQSEEMLRCSGCQFLPICRGEPALKQEALMHCLGFVGQRGMNTGDQGSAESFPAAPVCAARECACDRWAQRPGLARWGSVCIASRIASKANRVLCCRFVTVSAAFPLDAGMLPHLIVGCMTKRATPRLEETHSQRDMLGDRSLTSSSVQQVRKSRT